MKNLQKHCRKYLSSPSDPLTCWLSVTVLTRAFLGIFLQSIISGRNRLWGWSFFSRKCKFSVDYANPDKFEKIDNYKIIIFEFVALDSRFYWERILVIGLSTCSQRVSRCPILLKQNFLCWFCIRVIKFFFKKWCRAYLSNLSDPFTCWLSICVLTQGLLGI